MAIGKKSGGRKKGTPNKATAEIRSVAQKYGAAAIRRLAELPGRTNHDDLRRRPSLQRASDRRFPRAARDASPGPNRARSHSCVQRSRHDLRPEIAPFGVAPGARDGRARRGGLGSITLLL